MFCPNCGAEMPTGSKFCPNCGTPLNDEGVHHSNVSSDAAGKNQQVPPQTTKHPDGGSEEKPVRKHTGRIIAIIVAAVVVIAAVIVIIVIAGHGENDSNNNNAYGYNYGEEYDVPPGYFDPFEGVYLKCTGEDGNITAEFVFDDAFYDESAYYYGDVPSNKFTESKFIELYDGESVYLYVEGVATQQTIEETGLEPVTKVKTFYAYADGKYVTVYSDITDSCMKDLEEYGKEIVQEEQGGDIDINYIGHYFAVKENVTEVQNKFCCVYETNLEERPYTAVVFTQLMKYNDGSITYENSETFYENSIDDVRDVVTNNEFIILGSTLKD